MVQTCKQKQALKVAKMLVNVSVQLQHFPTFILAFTSMEIPTNTSIHKRLNTAINGGMKRSQKTLHFVAILYYR